MPALPLQKRSVVDTFGTILYESTVYSACCIVLDLICASISMTTMFVCREACTAGPSSETSHESALGVTNTGRMHQQGITLTYSRSCYLMVSVKPADQNTSEQWATPTQEACLKCFIKCCRSAFFEAGVHEGSVGGNIAVHVHGPEHPASCCQVPGA